MSDRPVEQQEQAPTEKESEEHAVEQDLDALLSDVKRERDEYLALAQRAKADFENYRKRAAREATDAERRGRASVARELVAPIDNLERALLAAGIDPNATHTADGEAPSEEVSAREALARGLALVYGELQAALARTGIESYDPSGERFDPSSSEAISTRADDGAEAGTVVETLERGYRLGDQVLRPARVIVAE
jgi:molecular chaperone GrpE